MSEYGIVANVTQDDRVMRDGAKVWLLDGWGGGGYERVVVYGLTKFSSERKKWIPLSRLENFRAAWIPEQLRDHVLITGDRPSMEARAEALGRQADGYRANPPPPYPETVLDLTPAGYCLTEDNRVSPYHKTQITEVDDDSYDVKAAKERGVELGTIVLPHHFKPGDLLVWYSDIGILCGSAGYLLVRNRRVAAYRRMVMS